MDTPEQEKPQVRIIELNQYFPLFDPNHPIKSASIILKWTGLTLRTNILPDLPMEAILSNLDPDTRSNEIFAPFDPQAGYTATADDLDLEKRAKKLAETESITVDPSKTPLKLEIGTQFTDILDTLLVIGGDKVIKGLKPEAEEIIKRLRLILTFPGQSYIGKPNKVMYDHGIYINEFHPTDFPLASSENAKGPLRSDSLEIGIPADTELQKLIIAKFVLVEEDATDDIPEVFRKAFESEE